eukprot:m.219503 g.219503  ORF g.219503 m.219503 type:complete len:680 (-) comp15115_c0_seq1:2855-4894(-)
MEEELVHDDVLDLHIVRGSAGFGFNIKGTTQAGGVLAAVNGRLYPPLQYISHVDSGGAAWVAGLRAWDRILFINKVDTRGLSHREVVDLVIQGKGIVDMVVLRVDDDEAARLQRIEDEGNRQKGAGRAKAAAISLDDFNNVPSKDGKGSFTVFNVYTHGTYRTSKRYSEFANLHKILKAKFPFSFAPFPPKKFNGFLSSTLGHDDLEERRQNLEAYLAKLMTSEDIKDCTEMRTFLERGEYVPPKVLRAEQQAKQKTAQQTERKPAQNKNSTPTATMVATRKGTGSVAASSQQAAVAQKQTAKPKSSQAQPSTAATEPPAQPQKTKKGLFDFDDDEPTPAAAQAAPPQQKGLFDFDDTQEVPRDELVSDVESDSEYEPEQAPMTELEEPDYGTPTAAVVAASDEDADDAEAVSPPPAPTMVKVLCPNSQILELEMDTEHPTAQTVFEAVAEELGLSAFAKNIFALFEGSAASDNANTVYRRLDEEEDVTELSASILLRKWLFCKEQEANADSDAPAFAMLHAQAVADIESGRVFCTAKKAKKFALVRDDAATYLANARKLKMYGGLRFPPCEVNIDNEPTTAVVTVTFEHMVLQKVDGDGQALVDDDAVKIFEWPSIKKVRRRDDIVAFKGASTNDEDLTVRIQLESAPFLEECIKRISLERAYSNDQEKEIEDNFFVF